jgi:hypothetical protein
MTFFASSFLLSLLKPFSSFSQLLTINMGFWDEFEDLMEDVGNVTWEVTKFAGKVATVGAAGATIAATGGLAAPLIGASVYVGGKVVKKIGEECDCKFVEGLGDFVEDVGLDGLTGGAFSLGTKACGYLAAKEIAIHGRKMTYSAKVLIGAGKAIKIGSKVYDIYDHTKEEIEACAIAYHGAHKRRTSYKSNCPICRGDL